MLDQPCDVLAQRAHGLQAFLVLADIVGGIAVDLVPVLGGGHRHIADGEIFVQPVKGSAGAAAAAGHHCRADLAAPATAGGVKQTVQKCTALAVGAGVIHGGAHHYTVELIGPAQQLVDAVLKDAQAAPLLALAAVDAALDGLLADPIDLAFHTAGVQGLGHFAQGGIGAAFLVGAAVDQ